MPYSLNKSKPFRLFLIACMIIFYKSIKSDSTGRFNFGTECSGCHGAKANTGTMLSLNGLPTSFIQGTTYHLNFTVTNAINHKAGFNVLVSDGELVAGTGSQINAFKQQITHTSPRVAVGNTSTFMFDWIAPKNNSTIVFKAAGNAVNDNLKADDSDQWNNTVIMLPSASNGIISKNQSISFEFYPNPCHQKLMVDLPSETDFRIFNLEGMEMKIDKDLSSSILSIDIGQYPNGTYLIYSEENGKTRVAKLIKD